MKQSRTRSRSLEALWLVVFSPELVAKAMRLSDIVGPFGIAGRWR